MACSITLNPIYLRRGKELSYNGFREHHMLGAFINLLCAVAYFARVVASFTDGDGFVVLTSYRYVVHMVTCPLLVRTPFFPATPNQPPMILPNIIRRPSTCYGTWRHRTSFRLEL